MYSEYRKLVLALLTWIFLLSFCHSVTNPSSSIGTQIDDQAEILAKNMAHLSRQMMADTTAREERVRSDGDSGLKQVRLNRYGPRPYHSETYTGRSFASIHDHANNIRTVGMGEVIGVLNGVEFRTRHNDYRLYMPSTTSLAYHETKPIPFPPVPKDVTDKNTVKDQISEMQEYFRAWKTQNETHRNYTDYFKPVLCYMEGTWTKGTDKIDEPFFSDRHFLRAKTWFELLDKVRMTSYTGSKDNQENIAYLPTKIMYMNGDTPVFAQWNYRIMCHPLKTKVPLNAFHVVDDLSSRMNRQVSLEQHGKSRAARFNVKSKNEASSYVHGFLDTLMEEIPGKNNYMANIAETTDSMPHMELYTDNVKNVGYYHRVFRVNKRGAMGTSTIMRGFNDAYLFSAMNNQTEVAPMVRDVCTGWGTRRVCVPKIARASWAIPLEIIYLTPLNQWNPYDIEYKGSYRSDKGKTVYNDKRNGLLTHDKAFNGTNSKTYFLTPKEFYTSGAFERGSGDTSRGDVGVLDRQGKVKITRASGVHVFLPPITDLGLVRLRYPIAPVYEEGSSTRKELEALKDSLMKKEKAIIDRLSIITDFLRDGIESSIVTNDTRRVLILQTSSSYARGVVPHSHTIKLTAEDLYDLRVLKKSVRKISSRDNGHDHVILLRARGNGFIMVKCDKLTRCADRHSLYLNVVRN